MGVKKWFKVSFYRLDDESSREELEFLLFYVHHQDAAAVMAAKWQQHYGHLHKVPYNAVMKVYEISPSVT